MPPKKKYVMSVEHVIQHVWLASIYCVKSMDHLYIRSSRTVSVVQTPEKNTPPGTEYRIISYGMYHPNTIQIRGELLPAVPPLVSFVSMYTPPFCVRKKRQHVCALLSLLISQGSRNGTLSHHLQLECVMVLLNLPVQQLPYLLSVGRGGRIDFSPYFFKD